MSADGSLPARLVPGVADDWDRLSTIRFGRDICGDLAAAERRERWIGNGTATYAAGTIGLSLTRRYHGLLITPVARPARPREMAALRAVGRAGEAMPNRPDKAKVARC
jgi:hypothetical protein